MENHRLSMLSEEERFQYDTRGLYLYPHQFEMPILIEKALKVFTGIGACILIVEQDTIYTMPEPEPEIYDLYVGKAGYVKLLKKAYHLLLDYISCDWSRLDPEERDEAVRIETYLIALDELIRKLEKSL